MFDLLDNSRLRKIGSGELTFEWGDGHMSPTMLMEMMNWQYYIESSLSKLSSIQCLFRFLHVSYFSVQ